MKLAGVDISEVRVGLLPAVAGFATLIGSIVAGVVWAKDVEADVEAAQTQVASIVKAQEKAAKEDRKLRDAVNALIVELRVRGAVSEAETAEAAPVEDQ